VLADGFGDVVPLAAGADVAGENISLRHAGIVVEHIHQLRITGAPEVVGVGHGAQITAEFAVRIVGGGLLPVHATVVEMR
jgi:hypothetical protein